MFSTISSQRVVNSIRSDAQVLLVATSTSSRTCLRCSSTCRTHIEKSHACRAGRTVASPKAGTLIDLTEDQATSKSELLQQAPLTSSVRGTVQEDVAGTPRPLPSHGMTTPVKKGSTMPTDRSPSTSGTKHKQVDIRQFFKSP